MAMEKINLSPFSLFPLCYCPISPGCGKATHFDFPVKGCSDFSAGLLHVVSGLQINPEFRFYVEISAKPQSCISSYFPPAMNDLTDSVRRNIDIFSSTLALTKAVVTNHYSVVFRMRNLSKPVSFHDVYEAAL